MRWRRSLNVTDLHGVMNGELSSILESDLKEFILAGTEEKVKL
jgi:hypothetical protein